jgi:GNAT superfamily N-acetyltransferase
MMDELTLLSEHVERAALEAIHRAASDDVRRQLGLALEVVGTATVSVSRFDPSILLNRAIGLGIDEPASRDTVDAVVARYRDHGIGRYYLHVHPEARPSELRKWVVDSGLERGRGWMKFRRGREEPPEARSSLEVRRADRSESDLAGRIITGAFGMKPLSSRLLAALAESADWRLYLALDGDTPAAAAAMFVHEGAAWLDWAATLPEFRRRGAQSLLMRRRMLDALDLGCRVMFTETGEAEGGDPQHSYRNILRAGFETAHLRENFVPPER